MPYAWFVALRKRFLGALGSVCSCLHLTFPSVYVPYVCTWLALPEPRQRPFRLGSDPIRPVMPSRCLSAAGFRFLVRSCACWGVRPPLPLAYQRCRWPPSGLSRSACVSCDRGGCRLYSEAEVSVVRLLEGRTLFAWYYRVNHRAVAGK